MIMKLMDVIEEMFNIQMLGKHYKIEFIPYRDDFEYLTKFNGDKVYGNEISNVKNYFFNKLDDPRYERHKKSHWSNTTYKPVEIITRKVGDKYIISFIDSSVMGKLVFTELDSFSSQYHKKFNPKD